MRQILKSPALALPLALIAIGAGAGPEEDIQRALIERQQRADELRLRIQQSQPPAASGDLRSQQELDALHLQQLQRLQNLNAQQLRQFDQSRQPPSQDPGSAQMQMQQQRQSFERDRQLELQQFQWEEQRARDKRQRPQAGSAPQ